MINSVINLPMPMRHSLTRLPALLIALPLLAFPFMATEFWVLNIVAQSLTLGLIALSLSFLAAYGGMVSLAQMTIAGFAGYAIALFSPNAVAMGVVLPWWLAVGCALTLSTIGGALVGWIAVRTQGIYMLMITLAIGMGFFFFVQQNIEIFNAFDGIRGIEVPSIGGVSLRHPTVFYFLCLALALSAYWFVTYVERSVFGLVLRALRDHPRKAASLGFHVAAHKVAAFGIAGFIAGIGGVLNVWYNQRISAGTIDLSALNAILIITVVGGLNKPAGAFLGAFVFVALQSFASSLVGAERFNTLIGLAFLVIVMVSPDGIVGMYRHLVHLLRKRASNRSAPMK